MKTLMGQCSLHHAALWQSCQHVDCISAAALHHYTSLTCDEPPVVAVKGGGADAAAAMRVGKGEAQLAAGYVPHAHGACVIRTDGL